VLGAEGRGVAPAYAADLESARGSICRRDQEPERSNARPSRSTRWDRLCAPNLTNKTAGFPPAAMFKFAAAASGVAAAGHASDAPHPALM
jgi:hypothetical protein